MFQRKIKLEFYLRISAVLLYFTWINIKNRSEDDLIKINKKGEILWSHVYIEKPPALPEAFIESIRLNELLAHPQYNCRNLISFPKNGKYSFALCRDLEIDAVPLNSNLTLISVVGHVDKLGFEKDLLTLSGGKLLLSSSVSTAIERWNAIKHNLNDSVIEKSKIAIKSLSLNGNGSDQWSTKEFRTWVSDHTTSNSDQLIVKLECGGCGGSASFASLLNDLITDGFFTRVHHLHLTIHIQKMDGPLLYKWYLVLMKLFYDGKMVLFNALQLGECGRVLLNCQYRLSFVANPPDPTIDVLAPIMGLGSPDEEYHRIVNHLEVLRIARDPYDRVRYVTPDCIYAFRDRWPCLSHREEMLLFKIPDSNIANELNSSWSQGFHIKNLHIFYPGASRNNASNIYYYDYGLSLSDKETNVHVNSGFSNQKSLERILQLMDFPDNQTLGIILDLDGGEYEFFETILSSETIQNRFNQLMIVINLWYGEEFENFRQLYSWLLRLQKTKYTHRLWTPVLKPITPGTTRTQYQINLVK